MRRPSGETPPPYVVTYTDTADAEWEAAYTFFASRNQPAAERWLVQVTNTLAARAADHAACPVTATLPVTMTSIQVVPRTQYVLVRGESSMS